jgi:hypothetical protein
VLADVRKADERAMLQLRTSGKPPKHIPLCVMSKGTRTFGRGTVRNTCTDTGFYGVREYNDAVLRGMLRRTIDAVAGTAGPPIQSIAEYAQLGAVELDGNEIERRFVSPLDARFARAVSRVVSEGATLSDGELTDLRRSLGFARGRTPAWKRGHFPAIMERQVKRSREFLLENLQLDEQTQVKGYTLGQILNVFDDNAWMVSAIQHAAGTVDVFTKHGMKISILRAPADCFFVVCDNPMRPYDPEDVDTILEGGDPGFGNPRCVGTFAIHPRYCLRISTGEPVDGARIAVDELQVRTINTAALLMAENEVVAPNATLDGCFLPHISNPLDVPPPRRP